MTDRRRGAVLVTVLWLIALLSALAMAAAITFRGFAGVVVLDRDRVQAEALLTGGLEAAVHTVDILGDTPLDELETTISLSTGSVHAHLSDEGGRIDIGKAPIEVLISLFRYLGAPPEAADTIALAIDEWRKPLNANRSNAAAQSPDDSVKKTNVDQPFTDIRQLARIPGMAPEWVGAIAPFATVYGSETVNPLTAPGRVLAALPGIDASRVEAFLQTRRRHPTDAAGLISMLGSAEQYLEVKTPPVVSVHLTATLANGFAQAARAVVVPAPDGNQPYRLLLWTPVALQSGG
jgi:type II secretory pathway component PulK